MKKQESQVFFKKKDMSIEKLKKYIGLLKRRKKRFRFL